MCGKPFHNCVYAITCNIRNLRRSVEDLADRVAALENGGGESVATKFLHIQERMSGGQAPVTPIAAGATFRNLNTVVVNTIEGAALISPEEITLPRGTFDIVLKAPCTNCNSSQVYLLQNGDFLLKGESGASLGTTSYATAFGRLTFAEPITFGMYHYLGTALTGQNIGVANSVGGYEIYAELLVWQVA